MAILSSHPLVSGCPPAWASAWGEDRYGPWCAFQVGDVVQRMRWIPPGRFRMGSPKDDLESFDHERPQHEVQLASGFWLFDMPCTQALWSAVMGTSPSRFEGPMRPVEQVSWEDCQQFLSTFRQKFPELPMALPTEAQWEHACRAETEVSRYQEDLDVIAWYDENSEGETHEVGQKVPNAWGLYDMLGNVYEWCHDGRREYADASVFDPVGPTVAGADRIVRGGRWGSYAGHARAAYRGWWVLTGFRNDGLGFRCSSSGGSGAEG